MVNEIVVDGNVINLVELDQRLDLLVQRLDQEGRYVDEGIVWAAMASLKKFRKDYIRDYKDGRFG